MARSHFIPPDGRVRKTIGTFRKCETASKCGQGAASITSSITSISTRCGGIGPRLQALGKGRFPPHDIAAILFEDSFQQRVKGTSSSTIMIRFFFHSFALSCSVLYT